jgi:phenylalanyl-tRNA synthetase beta chain
VSADQSWRDRADAQTTEEVEAARAKGLPTPPPQLKVEIPANRYDLLCLEGLARALRVFLELEPAPKYTLSVPEKMQEVYVEASVRITLSF